MFKKIRGFFGRSPEADDYPLDQFAQDIAAAAVDNVENKQPGFGADVSRLVETVQDLGRQAETIGKAGKRPPVPGTIDAELSELREGQEALANWMSQIANWVSQLVEGQAASQPTPTVAAPVVASATSRKRKPGTFGVRTALAGLAVVALVAIFSILPSLQLGQPGVQAAMVASLPISLPAPVQPAQQQAQQQTTQVAVQTPPAPIATVTPMPQVRPQGWDGQARAQLIERRCARVGKDFIPHDASDIERYSKMSEREFDQQVKFACIDRPREQLPQQNAVILAHNPMSQPMSVTSPPRRFHPPVDVLQPPVVIPGRGGALPPPQFHADRVLDSLGPNGRVMAPIKPGVKPRGVPRECMFDATARGVPGLAVSQSCVQRAQRQGRY